MQAQRNYTFHISNKTGSIRYVSIEALDEYAAVTEVSLKHMTDDDYVIAVIDTSDMRNPTVLASVEPLPTAKRSPTTTTDIFIKTPLRTYDDTLWECASRPSQGWILSHTQNLILDAFNDGPRTITEVIIYVRNSSLGYHNTHEKYIIEPFVKLVKSGYIVISQQLPLQAQQAQQSQQTPNKKHKKHKR